MKLLPMRKAGLSQTQKGKNSTQVLQVLVTGRKTIQREDKIRDVGVLSQEKVHTKKRNFMLYKLCLVELILICRMRYKLT
jgi:hypothetical protein